MRTWGPGEVDLKRIQAFIKEANGLIKDDERREAGGFKFQEPDFKFQRFPDWALARPLLSDKEVKVSRELFATLATSSVRPDLSWCRIWCRRDSTRCGCGAYRRASSSART